MREIYIHVSVMHVCVIIMTTYRNVSLPSTLVEDVEKHLEEMGFSSVAEAVKYSVRRWLDELERKRRGNH